MSHDAHDSAGIGSGLREPAERLEIGGRAKRASGLKEKYIAVFDLCIVDKMDNSVDGRR